MKKKFKFINSYKQRLCKLPITTKVQFFIGRNSLTYNLHSNNIKMCNIRFD